MSIKNLMDYLTCVEQLEIQQSDERVALAALLGIQKETTTTKEIEISVSDTLPVITDQIDTIDLTKHRRDIKQPIVELDKNINKPLHSIIERVAQSAAITPAFIADTTPITFEPALTKTTQAQIAPLFDPKYNRQTLFALGAMSAQKGGFDENQLVSTIGKLQPLLKIPRKSKPFIPDKIQLLIDTSEAMTPFLQDVKQLRRELKNTLGQNRIEILYFSGCPSRGVGRNARKHLDYISHFLPDSQTKVICIAGLGQQYIPGVEIPADVPEWVEFAHSIKNTQCALSIITPYGDQPVKNLNIVSWDRSTHPSQLLKW